MLSKYNPPAAQYTVSWCKWSKLDYVVDDDDDDDDDYNSLDNPRKT